MSPSVLNGYSNSSSEMDQAQIKPLSIISNFVRRNNNSAISLLYYVSPLDTS